MPNIVEYSATGELTPSDKGIQAAEVAGRRLGSFGQEVGGQIKQVGELVDRHMAVMETSELYKTGTELKQNLLQRWIIESGKPENRDNPHFGDQFKAEIAPMIDGWGSHVGTEHGKMLAATLGASIRNEVFNQVTAGQAAMDAAHVHDNFNQTINMLGAGLAFDPSEANLNRTLGAANTIIDGLTAAIPDVEARERAASQFRAERLPQIVASRYQYVAESIKQQVAETNDPAQSPAYDQLGKDIARQVGFQYLSNEQQEKLGPLRDEAVRQGQELYKAHDAAQRKKESDDFDQALLPIETSLYKDNGAGGVTIAVTPQALDAVQRAASLPGAKQHPERISSLLGLLRTATQDQIAGKEITTDRGTYVDMTGRIGSTTNPLTKAEVDVARSDHKLSDSDWSFLRTSAADSKNADPKVTHAFVELNQWVDRIKPAIEKSDILSGTLDAAGAINFSYFAQDAATALHKAIQSGQDPDAAVRSLTDPHNPRGLYAHMAPYMQTNKQGNAAVLRATSPSGGGMSNVPPPPSGIRLDHQPPPPAMPNEDPAAYRKRTGL